MDSHAQTKPKRRKKKAPRTQGPVDIGNGSDSDSSHSKEKDSKSLETSQQAEKKTTKPETVTVLKSGNNQRSSDADITTAFNRYYMQRVTTELAEDLDRVRGADDFQDSAVKVLISALQDGTAVFSKKEQKRVVMAGRQD